MAPLLSQLILSHSNPGMPPVDPIVLVGGLVTTQREPVLRLLLGTSLTLGSDAATEV